MIVCVCHNVTSGDIAAEAASGCGSFEHLQERLQVGTCCGVCLPSAKETFAEHREASVAHRRMAPESATAVA
jgi:bacterioferritin-associated ferredoxin